MKEIEIKVKLRDKREIMEKLEALGCVFSPQVKQKDTVYTRVIGTVAEYLTNDHFPRIRETNEGKFFFTVKADLSKHKNLSKIEHEIEIQDAKTLEQALLLMGYKTANTVTKNRQKGMVGEYEVCIDEVDDLGTFIEVEKMAEENIDQVRKELLDFTISLGVLPEDEVKRGYDLLMLEKQENL